ncbi:MAG: retropepsin-like aspartic protease [Candidatus Binatia bacterium]
MTPVAEIQGANGLKWFLVRTRNGSVGWTKQSNSEESKKLDNFFKSLPPEPSSLSSVEISTTSSATAPHGAVTVPVQISGRSIIIPVIFNHSLKTQLLLDTGATSTLVSKSIASSLALQEIGSATGVTVGGAITVPVARVKSLKVGSAEVVDLLVNIHNFSQDPRYEGLLGMDFLGRFNISLDQHKRVLILTPR